MNNKLEPILLQKKREVIELYQRLEKNTNHPVLKLFNGDLTIDRVSTFKKKLKASSLAVIAEIKRKSPSKGILASIADPASLAQRYIAGGASVLSVLTDKNFFDGHMNDLVQVSTIAHDQAVPILCKDFIIDSVQIAEAALAGASAVLCIIAAVGYQSKKLIEFAHTIGIDVLVEIHDQNELQIALDCGADIIGINNRNLNTFEVNTQSAFQIISAIPDSIIKVAESGITDPVLARQYHQAGFDAVLIGEALVTSADPEQFIKDCRYGV